MEFEQVALGKTGLKTARLGLGTAYGISANDILWAIDHGLNYIFWGSMRRRNVVKAVRSLGPAKRDKVIVASASYIHKIIPRPQLVRRSIERALKTLRTDYLDVFQLGWLGTRPIDEIIDMLLTLKDKGLIRHLGISSHDRKLAAELLTTPVFEIFMIRYNAAHRDAETEVFPFVDPSKHAVVSYSATRWGHLLKAPKGWPEDQFVPNAVDCYRFALSQPKVTLCLTGVKNIKQLKENTKALELGPMSEEELSRMQNFGEFVRTHTTPHSDPEYWLGKAKRLIHTDTHQ
jgi:aryl-alcohol dehydrogenase-like predicted oxidoreductase